jgi:UDP-N-acetylglucosamine 1-carboxyvinyltransferase
MNEEFKKIGRLISNSRLQRGMTQAELAKKLATSQSAINRIEKGNQNISIELLSRISDVLDRQIISLNSGSVSLRIEGGHELSGEITLKSSKNACVALLCASLLNKGTTKLRNVARIEEVSRLIEVMESIGVTTRWLPGNTLEIKPPKNFTMETLNRESAIKTRSAFMLAGGLMHHMKSFSLPHAGGCELGKRTVLPHIYGLEEFGVEVDTKSNRYDFNVKKKSPTRAVIMYESGDTATENILFAAAINNGTTTIKMASANYQVQDICLYLQKLGVKITGIGTTTLIVKGLAELPRKSVIYTPSEDPVEAMTFIAAAIATDSQITIRRTPIDFVELELYKIEKMGAKFSYSELYKADNGHTDLVDITVYKHGGSLTAPEEKVYGRPFPGLNIDNLPYFVPICAVAKGETLIHDWAYEDRALMFMDLKKVGVDMTLADIHRVIINGPTKWKAADMVCPQGLRPAVLILIGMLAAKGTSTLRNIYTINRGYEALADRLNSLGAKITVEHGL